MSFDEILRSIERNEIVDITENSPEGTSKGIDVGYRLIQNPEKLPWIAGNRITPASKIQENEVRKYADFLRELREDNDRIERFDIHFSYNGGSPHLIMDTQYEGDTIELGISSRGSGGYYSAFNKVYVPKKSRRFFSSRDQRVYTREE